MALLLDGTRFGMLRHIVTSRLIVGIMAFGLVALVATIMVLTS